MKRLRSSTKGGRRSHQGGRLIGVVLLFLFPLATGGVYGASLTWTGAGSGNDNWSTPQNWWPQVAPAPGDTVSFDADDLGNVDIVDTDFTIGLLRYRYGAVHTTNIPAGVQLQVTGGPLQVGGDGNATVTWTGSGSVAIGAPSPGTAQAVNIGSSKTAGTSNTGSLTINGVTVNAYSDSPSSGGVAMGISYSGGTANGSLVLGPGAQFNSGTPATPIRPGLTIGSNDGTAGGSATGLMDTSGGAATLHVDTLYVGNNKNGDPGALGTAAGTLTMGENTILTADRARIAWGDNTTGVVNLNGGLFAANTVSMRSGATFNFNGGRLAVNDFTTIGGAGTLEQKGGTLAPGFSRSEISLPGVSILRGGYQLDAAGALEIELFGTDPGTGHDQLQVQGPVNLAGGALDVKLNFEPAVGTQFILLDNDLSDPISGQFAGLAELGTLDEMYLDSRYRFQISYSSFASGNDVVLKMVEKLGGTPDVIPAPGALALGALGAGLMNWLRRRRLL